MDVIDTEGRFWLATHPEKRLFGRLKYDPRNGARLTIQGTFFDEEEVLSRRLSFDNTSHRILGLLSTRQVTLIGGSCVNRKTEFSGNSGTEPFFTEEWVIHSVLQGAHSIGPELPAFEALFLRLEYLEPWVNDRLITTGNVESPEGDRFQSSAVPRRSSNANAAVGNVEVSSSVASSFGWFDSSFRQESQLALFFDQGQTLEGVLSFCSALQNLLTIAAHKPSSILEIGLISSTGDTQDRDTYEVENYTTMCVLDVAARIPHDSENPLPPNMLFTVDEFGGAGFVSKWCEMSTLYKPVIDQLTSLWYSPWSYPEDAFSSAAQSAETLMRIDTGQQNLNLRIELTNLAKDAGPEFQHLIGDIDGWAGEIVQTRINRVVHRGLHETAAMPNWGRMSRTLYHLVVVHLLKRCGVEDHKVEQVSRMLTVLQFGQ